jgi:calcineurin-like phosphoesterase family protein/SdrD B-like protein
MRYALTFFIFLASISLSSNGQPGLVTISGYVFDDVNNNGVKDTGEKGIVNVAVSDQVNVVTTNKDGFYQIQYSSSYGILFMSVPNGFQSSAFWVRVDSISNRSSINFPLVKIATPSSFTFIHASDTHISEANLDRFQKFEQIVDSVKPDMVLITGDLVRDALRVPETEATRLYELFSREVKKTKAPVWYVPGNHEIFGIERHLSLVSQENPLYGRKMYHHYLGPDYYSFNYGGIHFIGLNSVEFDDLWYYGRIDSLQLEWLKKDVATVPVNTPIITFQHIPFFSGGFSMMPYEDDGPGRSLVREKGVLQYRHVVSNAQDVFMIMKDHNYPLALSGHYHFQQKFSFEGLPTRLEQTAAVVGPSDEGNLKMPSGITVYHVKDGKIDEGKFVQLDR